MITSSPAPDLAQLVVCLMSTLHPFATKLLHKASNQKLCSCAEAHTALTLYMHHKALTSIDVRSNLCPPNLPLGAENVQSPDDKSLTHGGKGYRAVSGTKLSVCDHCRKRSSPRLGLWWKCISGGTRTWSSLRGSMKYGPRCSRKVAGSTSSRYAASAVDLTTLRLVDNAAHDVCVTSALHPPHGSRIIPGTYATVDALGAGTCDGIVLMHRIIKPVTS